MNPSLNVLPSANGEFATLFVALELSKSKWLVALRDPVSGKISRQTLEGGDSAALLARIATTRLRAEAALGGKVKVISCYEAGYDGFWLHRLLVTRGIESHVIDPASLEVNRRARRVKTDKVDLEKLLRTLQAFARGEKDVCRMVRVPSVEEEDARRRSRERQRLVNEKTQHINRIKGLLMTQGVRNFSPERGGGEKRLDKLETGDGQPLPPCLKAETSREIARLHQVLAMIKTIEAEQEELIASNEQSAAATLMKLRALGLVGASVLANEVFFRDFRNRREVGSYFGLDDSRWQSGDMDQGQGISKAGNPRGRALMIELAWLWLRWQPQSALSLWFKARVGENRGRVRRVAIVALARKLAVALWRYVTTGLIPEGAVLKA